MHMNISDKKKTKLQIFWGNLNVFCKLSIIGAAIIIVLFIIAVYTHKPLPIFISILQIGGLIVSFLIYKNIIRIQNKWLKFLILIIALLFSVLNIMSYSVGKSKHTDSKPPHEDQVQTTEIVTETVNPTPEPPQTTNEETTVPEKTENIQQTTNNIIEKGTQYAYMSDEWTVYIATAISDSTIKIEAWDKFLQNQKNLSYSYDVDVYKINDTNNGFSWLDDEHTAFDIIFKDKNNSRVKKATSHTFTINLNDSDTCKGTDYDEKIACYSSSYDDWTLYKAIPLSEHLIKVECWTRVSSIGNFLFGYDWGVINTEKTDTDFEWTDETHSIFTISFKDPSQKSWKEEKLVAFELENESYVYSNVISALKQKAESNDNTKTPSLTEKVTDEKNNDEKNNNEIVMDFDETLCLFLQPDVIKKSFEDLGFNDITIKEETSDKALAVEGLVSRITINGNTFKIGDKLPSNSKIIIYKSTVTNREDMKETTTDQSKNETVSPSPSPSPSPTPSILTLDNSEDLKSFIHYDKENDDSSISSFVSKNKGKKIELNMYVAFCEHNGSYKTRFNYLLYAYEDGYALTTGPAFYFEDVNFYNLHITNDDVDTFNSDTYCKVQAKIEKYKDGMVYIKPTSITVL